MHLEKYGGFQRQLLFDVIHLVVLVVFDGVWRLEILHEIAPVQDLWFDENRQVGVVGTSVPSIRDVSALHDLSEEVLQVIPRHFVLLLCVVHEHIATDLEVTVVEILLTRPSQSTLLDAAHYKGVLHAKCEQNRLEFFGLRTFVQKFLTEL